MRCALGLLSASSVGVCYAANPISTNTTWSPLRLGGSGLVPGMFFHPKAPAAYIKTDVGGAYRRVIDLAAGVNKTSSWKPLLDWISADYGAYYSVSELLMDPTDPNRITAMLGAYVAWGACMIAKSEDAGDAWAVAVYPSNWTAGITGPACGGNQGDRASGRRMVSHPTNSSILLLGSYDGHVYVTADAFSSGAAQVKAVVLPGLTYPSPLPVRSLEFLPCGASSSGCGTTALAFIPGQGVWMNPGPDYGSNSSWSYVEGSNATYGNVHRTDVDQDMGHLYFTRDGGFGRSSMQEVPPSSGTWTLALDWYHAPADGFTYNGLAWNPDPSRLVNGTARADLTFVSLATNSTTTLWRTLDGGATWFTVPWQTESMIPWSYVNTYGLQLNSAASFHYDPFPASVPGNTAGNTTVWLSDFFGTWRTTDYDSVTASDGVGKVTFSNVMWGIEEMCMFSFVDPPYGPYLISGAADTFAWTHTGGMDAYPSTVFPTPDQHNLGWCGDYTLSTAVSPSNASMIVPSALWYTGGDEYGQERHGWYGNHHWVGVSTDGGLTFRETAYDTVFNNTNAIPYRIAVHPWNGNVSVIAGYQGLPVVYTLDMGVSWRGARMVDARTGVDQGPLLSVGPWGNFWWASPLVRENNIPAGSANATFYYYNGTTSLFTSVDSGVSWTLTYDAFPTWNVPLFAVAVPPRGTAAPGDLWVFSGWQLHYSSNGGANFTQKWQFSSPKSGIAVGPLPPVVSRRTGRSAADMSALCAQRLPVEERPKAAPKAIREEVHPTASGAAPYPLSTAAGPAYIVYAAGQAVYGDKYGVFMSVDYGQSWVELTTPAQELGDSPVPLVPRLAQPGILMVGTDGRGGFYANVTQAALDALEACEMQ